MTPGRFITFEGGEGSGKTTQIKLLSAALADRDIKHIVTREPGGTPLAEKVRPLVVEQQQAGEDWHPLAETLLFLASRIQHWEVKIKPALESGLWVLCDRFIDSTLVYQGIGKKLGADYLLSLHHLLAGKQWLPDYTLLLDIDPKIGLARAHARQGAEMRFEALDHAFHEKLRDGFLHLAALEPERYRILQADQEPQKLGLQILKALF